MGRPMTEAGKLRRQISMQLDDAADIRREINEVMAAYGLAVDEEMQKAMDEVAKDAVLELRAHSMGNGWKNYARGWVYESKPDKRGVRRMVLYNKKYGSLTHLLENGHEKILWGNKPKSVGTRVPGKPHIKPVADMVAKELPNKIEELLKKTN